MVRLKRAWQHVSIRPVSLQNGAGSGELRRFLLIVMLVSSIAIITTVLVTLGPREPRYAEQSLHWWLMKLETAETSGEKEAIKCSIDALRAIDTNALPTLFADLTTPDSNLKQKLISWLNQQKYLSRVRIEPYALRSRRAQLGYHVLGPIVTTAHISLLINTLTNSSLEVCAAAIAVLGDLGDTGSDATSALLNIAKQRDNPLRAVALTALNRMHPPGWALIPVLMDAIHDPYSSAQREAIIGLANYGAESKIAIPALLQMLTNDFARVSIKHIDPEAAEKLGF